MTSFLLVLPLVAAAPVPKELRTQPVTLDGTWRCESVDVNGQPSANLNMTWRFADNAVRIEYGGPGVNPPMPITLDTKASPMGFSFLDGARQIGVFERKGDTAVICLSLNGQRPTTVAGGQNVARYTLSRVTDK